MRKQSIDKWLYVVVAAYVNVVWVLADAVINRVPAPEELKDEKVPYQEDDKEEEVVSGTLHAAEVKQLLPVVVYL
jgi:hypothetical protein